MDRSKLVRAIFTLLIGVMFLPLFADAAIYGGIEFPLGEASFADSVVSYIPGPLTEAPANNP